MSQQYQTLQDELATRKAEEAGLSAHAEEMQAEAHLLREQLISLASRLQNEERRITALEQKLAELQAKEATLLKQLLAERVKLSKILHSLQKLHYKPRPGIMLYPENILDALHATLALAGSVPILRQRADHLSTQLDKLSLLRGDIARQKQLLTDRLIGLDKKRQELERLYAAKRETEHSLRQKARQETKQIASLTEKAQSLDELITRLEQSRTPIPRPLAENTLYKRFSKAKGKLPLPAQGILTAHYGQKSGHNSIYQGIELQTRAGASIISPFDGRVLYAGSFRNYGKILILGVGEGYHILLAGLEHIEAVSGQDILAGEPIASMPHKKEVHLYIEIRYKSTPINPKSWFQ